MENQTRTRAAENSTQFFVLLELFWFLGDLLCGLVAFLWNCKGVGLAVLELTAPAGIEIPYGPFPSAFSPFAVIIVCIAVPQGNQVQSCPAAEIILNA